MVELLALELRKPGFDLLPFLSMPGLQIFSQLNRSARKCTLANQELRNQQTHLSYRACEVQSKKSICPIAGGTLPFACLGRFLSLA
jgi:hypothetical protein